METDSTVHSNLALYSSKAYFTCNGLCGRVQKWIEKGKCDIFFIYPCGQAPSSLQPQTCDTMGKMRPTQVSSSFSGFLVLEVWYRLCRKNHKAVFFYLTQH